MEKILIIDDDPDICTLLGKFLTREGYSVDSAGKGMLGLELMKSKKYDLVLCDFKLPDADGIELIQKINVLTPEAMIIMITGYSDVKIAVKAMRMGAHDYVTKPLYPDEILVSIKSALSSKKEQVNKPGKSSKSAKSGKQVNQHEYVNGTSNQAKLVQKHIDLIAPTDMSVVILGETGTGKEFVARAIHDKSQRKEKPFIAIDCGALPKELAGSELFGHVKGAFTGAVADKIGSIEEADNGTLFLDEIGNLTYDNQIKLLRVLQEKKIKKLGTNKEVPIDVRILVATNEDLGKAVSQGTFREDLFYRFNEFKIILAPIRERKSDVLIYANHFLGMANETLGKSVNEFSTGAFEKLMNYYWHGNLRELKNVVKRAVLMAPEDVITIDCLPDEIVNPKFFEAMTNDGQQNAPDNLKSVAEIAERDAIIDVLEKTGNNKSKAATILKIDRKTLYNKLKAYNIDK